MMSYLVHSCITIQILDINVWTIIIWPVMHRINCLEYDGLDVVFKNY